MKQPSERYILYDFLQVAGGAERLTLTLAEAFPEWTLYVARRYPEAGALGESVARAHGLGDRRSALLGRIPEAIYGFKRRTRFLRRAQAVLYSGYYAPLAAPVQEQGRRLYYCHTPPRFAYDLKADYLTRLPPPLRPLFNTFLSRYLAEYDASLRTMDRIIANSENVRDRLMRQFDLSAAVVHPPIETARFTWRGEGDYFVSLARLMPAKRVELIVHAFLAMPDERLVVASGGPELARLRALAGDAPNIQFTGWCGEAELADLLGHARAAIYIPVDEDFGMSPVEAMAAGKPVIGVAEGGLLETIVDGETGILLPSPPGIEALKAAVKRLTKTRAATLRGACQARAALFSRQRFIEAMAAYMG